MVILRPFKSLVATAAIALALGCGGDTTQPQSTPAVSSVSGNNQTGTAGQALADPLVVRVTRDGSGLAGTSVSWTVTGGAGSASPATSVTDSNGQASTTWTLGPTDGANTLEASATGATGSPVQFTATGTPFNPPSAAGVSVGDNFFNPTSSTIALNGTVTWTWAGSLTHNVTFGSGTNSANQSAGTFVRTFDAPGTFDYQCTIHGSSMSGTIVVVP